MLGFGRKEEPAVVVPEEPTSEEAETTTGNHCAWCGDPPDECGSHGMCTDHANEMLGDYYWNRLQRVPAYTERFQDGRETWEE